MAISKEYLENEIKGLYQRSTESYELALKYQGAAEILKQLLDRVRSEEAETVKNDNGEKVKKDVARKDA